jgi:hypothetical protein
LGNQRAAGGAGNRGRSVTESGTCSMARERVAASCWSGQPDVLSGGSFS